MIQEPCSSLANEKLVGVKYTETKERVYQDLEFLISSETVLNEEKIYTIVYTEKPVEEKDDQNLKFPVSSFSSSLAKGTRAWPRPVLLPLRP